jgi:hypothetical protein
VAIVFSPLATAATRPRSFARSFRFFPTHRSQRTQRPAQSPLKPAPHQPTVQHVAHSVTTGTIYQHTYRDLNSDAPRCSKHPISLAQPGHDESLLCDGVCPPTRAAGRLPPVFRPSPKSRGALPTLCTHCLDFLRVIPSAGSAA